MERTVCPIVVSVLCKSAADIPGATFQRTKAAAVGSEVLLKLSCVHRCCHRALFNAARVCLKERKGKGVRQGMEEDDRSSLLIVLAYRRFVTNELTFLFNACFFRLWTAFGNNNSRTRARVHCARS